MDSSYVTRTLALVRSADRRHGLFRPGGLVVGVSGGCDSVALLDILDRERQRLGLRLHVAHLHHGIRGPDADEDAAFARRKADECGLPCTVEREDVPALAAVGRLALEEASRQARYAFLARVACREGADRIAVAHHADDQAETVLMHLLRGAGLAGLRGMLPITDLRSLHLTQEVDNGPLWLIRPLLEVPRELLLGYCDEAGLSYRFDRSNLDTTMYRNRLRHELVPYLRTFNPNLRDLLCRTAAVAADDYALQTQLVDAAWRKVLVREESDALVFDLQGWRTLHPSLQRGIVRRAVHSLRKSLRNIGFMHICDAVKVAALGEAGDSATLPSSLALTLGYDRFWVAETGWAPPPSGPQLGTERLPVAAPGVTPLPASPYRLEVRRMSASDARAEVGSLTDPGLAWFDAGEVEGNLVVRTRRAGDRFRPLGLAGHSKSVHEFMINAKVPRSERECWPLLTSGGRILWIIGLRAAEDGRLMDGTQEVWRVQLVRQEEARGSA